MSKLLKQRVAQFQTTVYDFYHQNGRHDLPWRHTTSPYNIVVSEVMLQQTQVGRVVPKYCEFMKRWPSARRLAAAPLKDVLIAWQGLGYNRRAKRLHECVRVVTEDLSGIWPITYDGLQHLPGIGPYTAGAVLAFAYNEAAPIVETNIRSVYLHHFFPHEHKVTDKELLEVIEKTLDTKNPRQWYWALMDYGAHLKQTTGNQNLRSRHYTKQSKFAGSDRQVRGAIIRILSCTTKPCSIKDIAKAEPHIKPKKLHEQLSALEHEGLIVRLSPTSCWYTLPE